MARSAARSSPYVVEIQRKYHLSEDELAKKGKKGHHIRPPGTTSDPSLLPRVHSHTRKSHVSNETDDMGKIPTARHVALDPSRLNRHSLEYEDIYTQRNYTRETSRLGKYGRYSYRDDSGYERRGRVRGDTRRSLGITRDTEMNTMNGEVRHVGGKTMDRRDITDITYQNRTGSDRNGRRRSSEASYKEGNMGTKHKQNRRDNNDNKRDDLELWIARQTSFPRKVEQNVKVEMTNQSVLRNNGNAMLHNSISGQSNSVHGKSTRAREPPPVAPKPPRSIPQTSRSASPASSIRSNLSGASSHVSQHSGRSAASEVSVKSILKKPKPGRVVLKEEPSSYTMCAVLSCIFCFPVGIYALVKSKRVKEAVDENDYESALSSSRKVKHFCIGVLVAYIGLLAVAGALLALYFTTGKIF